MTAEIQDPEEFLQRANGYMEDAVAAHRLLGTSLAGLEACLTAYKAARALQVQEEAVRALEDDTEADPPYLGWQPGDEIEIRTMGGRL